MKVLSPLSGASELQTHLKWFLGRPRTRVIAQRKTSLEDGQRPIFETQGSKAITLAMAKRKREDVEVSEALQEEVRCSGSRWVSVVDG